MKSFKIIAVVIAMLITLASCEHKVVMNTVVHEDGSLDKMIVIEGDSAKIDNNFIGVGSTTGWDVTIVKKDSTQSTDQGKFILTYKKHFNSVEEANHQLSNQSDTLFRITSQFEKKFKWFYTYIRYSDTYGTINRLQYPIADYFTQEDFSFINRLPAEGNPISRADSVYLDVLNDKIFEVYGTKALFEAYYNELESLLKSENQLAWIDTLRNHKHKVFESLQDDKNIDDFSDMLKQAGIPNLPVSESEIVKLEQKMEKVTNFISTASNGKYIHSITMPFGLIYSNADSVAGNTLYWKPSSIKFLLKDYEMVGEARKPNFWALAVSIAFIALSITLIFRKKRSKRDGN